MTYRFSYKKLAVPIKNNLQVKIKGFSLIELMIVMAIMAVLMSLTGGLAIKNVSKRERLVEIEQVAQIFKRLNYQAYYTGYEIQVNLRENILTATTADETTIVEFKQLSFVNRDYVVSTKAFVSPSSYRITWQNSYKDFDISPMFKTNEN